MLINLRTIFEESGIQLDALWFYDTEKNRFMWVLPENFFRQTKEELLEVIKKLDCASALYCERCNKLQHPFREYKQKETTQINRNDGFSEFGCIHFSKEEVDHLNEELKAERIQRKL